MNINRIHICVLALLLAMSREAWPAQGSPAVLALQKLSFVYGREYFVLRSGRAKMIVQADRVDLGPAFTFILVDATNPSQTHRKEMAFNFASPGGFTTSALQVVLGGFPFTALGNRTETRWVDLGGIPAVEAVWWAGGIRVTERIRAVGNKGAFQRSIQLEGADLVGPEHVELRLSAPRGTLRGEGSILLQNGEGYQSCLVSMGKGPARADEAKSQLVIGPIAVVPRARVTVETALLVEVPPRPIDEVLAQARTLQTFGMQKEQEQTKQAWAATSVLATGDKTIQEIYDKARVGLPGMIFDDGTMDAGIFWYGDQWVRDGSNTALGAVHAGMFEVAHNILQKILTMMIDKQGGTMVASHFEKPDMEELDQMGVLLHALKAYGDWTGDDSLVREHRAALLAMIERPLQPQFRDATGMVHDRREYWERNFADGYELIYQAYVARGLRDAAAMAPALGAEAQAGRWKQEADRILHAVLSDPTRSLVVDGRLIKRRTVAGEVADSLPSWAHFEPDIPSLTEAFHRLNPDTASALPIALGLLAPRSPIALKTLDDLEPLWSARWSDGGYGRYNASSEPGTPGAWPLATCFVLRAQHDAGQYERSRRSLEWLNTMGGGRSGAWFEEIPSLSSHDAALIPWVSGEITLFVIYHWLGVRFEGGRVVLRPNLYPGSPSVTANLRFRTGRLRLQVDGSGPVKTARVDGTRVKPNADGSVTLPADFTGGTVMLHTAGGRHEE
jgi:hypothetical protein